MVGFPNKPMGFPTNNIWNHHPVNPSTPLRPLQSQMHKRRKSTVFTASSSPSRSRLHRLRMTGGRWPLGGFGRDAWYIDIYIYLYLEPKWPLFWLEFKLFFLGLTGWPWKIEVIWVPGVKYKIKRCPTHQNIGTILTNVDGIKEKLEISKLNISPSTFKLWLPTPWNHQTKINHKKQPPKITYLGKTHPKKTPVTNGTQKKKHQSPVVSRLSVELVAPTGKDLWSGSVSQLFSNFIPEVRWGWPGRRSMGQKWINPTPNPGLYWEYFS